MFNLRRFRLLTTESTGDRTGKRCDRQEPRHHKGHAAELVNSEAVDAPTNYVPRTSIKGDKYLSGIMYEARRTMPQWQGRLKALVIGESRF